MELKTNHWQSVKIVYYYSCMQDVEMTSIISECPERGRTERAVKAGRGLYAYGTSKIAHTRMGKNTRMVWNTTMHEIMHAYS